MNLRRNLTVNLFAHGGVLSLVTGALWLVHCASTTTAERGAHCSLNSECTAPLVCGFERCRPQCNTARDCQGKLCVRGETGNVCQLDDEVECTHNSQCPGSQVCGHDGRCRDVCITDRDCITDLLCVSRTCAKREELVRGQLPDRTRTDAGAFCTYATDCPGDLVCLYGACDVECLGTKDCLVGWECHTRDAGGDGRCYPSRTARADASTEAGDASIRDGGTETGDGGAPLPKVQRVVAGAAHNCVIFDTGKIKCWGYNEVGQLGLGDTLNRGDDPGEMGDKLPYVDLGTGRTATALSAGTLHTCAILDNGKVKCWGNSKFGQLGLGDTLNRGDQPNLMGDNLPYVDLGTGRTALAISAGTAHTCARLDNGKVKCWGRNLGGTLGLGDGEVRGDGAGEMGDNLPYVDLGTGRTALMIAAADANTCALLDNGNVKCWGTGNSGQVGLGDTLSHGSQPNQMGDNLAYVDLGAGRLVNAIDAKNAHTCSLLDNGNVKCWGYNFAGVLGLGDAVNRGDQPNQMGDKLPYVDLGAGRTATIIAAGSGSSCALLDNGKLKCWGYNSTGELGLGDTVSRGDQPNQMGNNLPDIDLGTARSAVAIAAGFQHVCTLLDDGGIKCWGWNAYGELGIGDVTNRGDKPNQMGDRLPYVKLVGP